MNVSIRRTDMFVQNGCACSNRMDMSIGTVVAVPTKQMCLFGMIVPIQIERLCLRWKASFKFLYKGRNPLQKKQLWQL